MTCTIFDELNILLIFDNFLYQKDCKGIFFMLKVKSRAGESVQQMVRVFFLC